MKVVLVFMDMFDPDDVRRKYVVYLDDLQVTYDTLNHQGEVIANIISDIKEDDFGLWEDTKDGWHFTDWFFEV